MCGVRSETFFGDCTNIMTIIYFQSFQFSIINYKKKNKFQLINISDSREY